MTKRIKRPVLDVRIRFGNAAMLTPDDAAEALQQVVERLRANGGINLTEVKHDLEVDRVIFDANGQRVGRWSLRHRTMNAEDSR